MATTLGENSVEGDKIIFEDIMKHAYANFRNMDPERLLRRMVQDGVIQIDALFEQAISVQGKLARQSVEGRDFADGSDAKKALTQPLVEAGKTPRRVAPITNIEGKHGSLRIIVGETVTGKTYYFKVPKRAYRGLRSIRIYFNENGTPKDGKWFRYRVNTFEELCV
jgi:Mor family transcriptional regulator